MRHVFLVMFLIGVLLATSHATATVTDLTVIDYKSITSINIQGNVTLSFLYSDTGSNDLILSRIAYNTGMDQTQFYVESKNITTNYSGFVNNTKYYLYTSQNHTTYRIGVDFSHVPGNSALNQLLNEKNLLIDSLRHNVTIMNATILYLRQNISALPGQYASLIASLNKNNTLLKNLSSHKDVQITALQNQTTKLENDLNTSTTQLEEMKKNQSKILDVFSIQLPDGSYHVNISSMAIGALLLLIGVYVITRSKKGKKIMPDIIQNRIDNYREDKIEKKKLELPDKEILELEAKFLDDEREKQKK